MEASRYASKNENYFCSFPAIIQIQRKNLFEICLISSFDKAARILPKRARERNSKRHPPLSLITFLLHTPKNL
jgi:hypothetical protein